MTKTDKTIIVPPSPFKKSINKGMMQNAAINSKPAAKMKQQSVRRTGKG